MSNQYYELYLADVFTLTKSMVVKSTASADAINKHLLENVGYNTISDLESQWKYYMNLAGEYHATDVIMHVISIDNLEEIAFTKENLIVGVANDDRLVHRATRKAYAVGTRYYNELVRKYPDQELLIKGILNPIDITVSTNAKDHQILYYDSTLVESNEMSLIPDLQDWINKYFIRWDVPAYGLIDELYTAAHLGIMWLNIPSVILNLRLSACKSIEAHSYHIREYLASHDHLDVFLDYMSKKQALFLYRNIRYIQRHAGKKETFQMLVDNILTDRGIPLNAWDLNHNVEDISINLYPTTELLFDSMNGITSELYKKTSTVNELLTKQIPLAKDNSANLIMADEFTQWAFNTNRYSLLNTKVLESSMVDYTEATPYKMIEVLMNEWLYLSYDTTVDNKPRYQSVIIVKHPNTGEDLNLLALDAFILFLYAFNLGNGNDFESKLFVLTSTDVTNQYIDLPVVADTDSIVFLYQGETRLPAVDYTINYTGGVGGKTRLTFTGDLGTGGSTPLAAGSKLYIDYRVTGGIIPTLTANRIRRNVLPTVNDLMRVVDNSKVDIAYAEAALDNQPSIDSYTSIESFFTLCKDIHKNQLYHRSLYSQCEDKDTRAYVERMVELLYQDVTIDLAGGMTYDDWFSEKQIVIQDLTREQWAVFATEIMNTATGFTLNDRKTVRSVQKAMLEIMSKLSSYSVQYLRSMVDNLSLLEWVAIRFSEDTKYKAFDKKQIQIADVDVEYNAKGYAEYSVGINQIGADIDLTTVVHEFQTVDVTIGFDNDFSVKDTITGMLPMAEFMDFTITVLPPPI